MLDSRDRVRFATQVDQAAGGKIVMTFYDITPEEGREITALVSRMNDRREWSKRDLIKLAGGEPEYRLPPEEFRSRPEPEPEPKPSGNRFSGLDIK